MSQSRTRRRKNRTPGRRPSRKGPNAPRHDLAYLSDIGNGVLKLVAQKNHELHNLNGYHMGGYDDDGVGYEIGRTLAEQHVQPNTLDECGPVGHQHQAWSIMRFLQEGAVPCSKCGKTPQFADTESGAPELGFRCEVVTEDIEPEAYVIHELYLSGETALRFAFRSEITRLEWPEKGSTNLTHSPYPGDDAVTVEWLMEELTERGNIVQVNQATNPDDGTPFTDQTLREYLELEREDWNDFPSVFADIERGLVGDEKA